MTHADVRSIDVGYGWTKYTHSVDSTTGRVIPYMFPSVAPIASADGGRSMGLDNRSTVRVAVDGVTYEVGPDAFLALPPSFTRTRHTDYSSTAEYLALVRGALTYMNVDEIDTLVVGLPVSLMKAKTEVVARRLTGLHTVGHGRKVLVNNVMTLPQPIGGFFSYVSENSLFGKIENKTTLIIDPGYVTLDWVTAHGTKPVAELCGSNSGGVSIVLDGIAKAISTDLGVVYTSLSRIEEALIHDTRLQVGRHSIDLNDYIERCRPQIDNAVQGIISSLVDRLSIDSVVLVGGGHRLFRASVARLFPDHDIHLVKNPSYANVLGFQIAGEVRVSRRRRVEASPA